MCSNSNDNLIFCIKDNNEIYSSTTYFNKFKIICSDIFFDENKKVIFDNKKCVLN